MKQQSHMYIFNVFRNNKQLVILIFQKFIPESNIINNILNRHIVINMEIHFQATSNSVHMPILI